MNNPLMPHETSVWSVAQAKARLSEVMDRAIELGPQRVTKNGRDAVVIISVEEWDAIINPKESLAAFFERSPVRELGIELERYEDAPRAIEL